MPRFAEPAAGGPRGRIGAVVRGLERWLLPAECLLCRRPVAPADDDALVCGLCRSRWRAVSDPVCPRCGEPREPREPLEPGESCRLCAGWPPGLVRVRSAVRLEESARDAVHRLKYEGWWRITEAMAARMAGLELLTAGVSLIPVPLAPRRERLRGYNQSERLAAALGRRLGLGVRTDLLRRTRATRTQTALTPDERRANVAGAFAAVRSRGLRAVLVDDVFTTGATLLAAAEALTAAGAESVDAVTFGRAVSL
jgi:ComF family protein